MKKEEHSDVKASFDHTDLKALAARVKQVLDIRDHKYGFPSKTYPPPDGAQTVRQPGRLKPAILILHS
jgi:hypothetical protein